MKFKEERKITLELTAAEYKTIYSILMNIPEAAVYNLGCIPQYSDGLVKELHKMRTELPKIG